MQNHQSSHALEAGGERELAVRFIKSGTKKVGGADSVGVPRKTVATANVTHSVLWLHSPGGTLAGSKLDLILFYEGKVEEDNGSFQT